MNVKDLISLLEGLPEEDKEAPVLAQVWDPENGLSEAYFEITSLCMVYERVEYAKDGATAKSVPPTVILAHNPQVNQIPTAVSEDSEEGQSAEIEQ